MKATRSILWPSTLFMAFSLPLSSYAADGTWTPGGTTSDWSNSTNWVDGIVAGGIDSTATLSRQSWNINTPSINIDSPITLGRISGTFSIGSNQSASINLEVSSGTPQITVVDSTSYIMSAVSGSQGFEKNGAETLWLRGANTYSGITQVNQGTLSVTNSDALGLGGEGNGTVVTSGSTLFAYGTGSGNITFSNEALSLAGSGVSNNGALQLGRTATWTGDVTLAEATKIASVDGYATGTLAGNVLLQSNELTLNGIRITGDISGSGGLTVEDAAALAGSNSYSGATSVGADSTLTVETPASLYNGNEASWTKENISVAAGGILNLKVGGDTGFTGTQAASLFNDLSSELSNNGLQAGSMIGFDTSGTTGDFTYSQAITDSSGTGGGSIGLYKSGTGNLVLDQANSYSGNTWVNEGTLTLSGSTTLGDGSGKLIMTGGALDLGGTTQVVSGVDSSLLRSGITYTSSSSNISNGTLVSDGTFELRGEVSANLSGSADLRMNTGTSVSLSGTNTFTGNIYVDYGTLHLASPDALYGGDLSQYTSEKIAVSDYGELAMSGVSGAEAQQIFNQLNQSNSGQGLNSNSMISFDWTGGDYTWTTPLTDSIGNTGGATNLNLYAVGVTDKIILTQTGTFTGRLWVENGDSFQTAIEFGADYATGTGTLIGGPVDLNGHDMQARGINAYAIRNFLEGSTSNVIFHVPDNAFGDGSFYTNLDGSGDIHLVKSGLGDATYGGGYASQAVKSLSVSAGDLILNVDHEGSITYDENGNPNANGYSAIVENGAKLYVNQSTAFATTVQSGALLGGDGQLLGGVTIESGATLSPGGKTAGDNITSLPNITSIASLGVNGVSFASSSTFAFQVDSSAALASNADLLMVGTGQLNLDLTQLAFGDVAANPQAFASGTVISMVSYFAGQWNGGLFVRGSNILEDGEEFFMGQNYWVIDYDATEGGLNFADDFISDTYSGTQVSGDRFITLTATVVPESSTMMLGLLGGMVCLRRRRSK